MSWPGWTDNSPINVKLMTKISRHYGRIILSSLATRSKIVRVSKWLAAMLHQCTHQDSEITVQRSITEYLHRYFTLEYLRSSFIVPVLYYEVVMVEKLTGQYEGTLQLLTNESTLTVITITIKPVIRIWVCICNISAFGNCQQVTSFLNKKTHLVFFFFF